MTSAEDGKKKKRRTRKRPAPASEKRKRAADAPDANGGLTGKQALALWELVLTGDGKSASKRAVKLKLPEVKGLEGAGLLTIESGPRKKNPLWRSKVHLTDEAWAWANQQGLKGHLSRSPVAARLLEKLLGKIGHYLETHDLPLDHVLRPRRAEVEPGDPVSSPPEERPAATPGQVAPATLEERIRAAYLRITGGFLNEYVRLALLRAELRGEPAEAVDAELRAMQQRGGAVLYPIDAPQRLRPEDDAAALRVAGERRDLLCIRG